jgi:hypothetical protein
VLTHAVLCASEEDQEAPEEEVVVDEATGEQYPYEVFKDERDVAFSKVVNIPTMETGRFRVEDVRLDLKDLSNTAANNMLMDRDVCRSLLRDFDTVYAGSHGFFRAGVGCFRYSDLELLDPSDRGACVGEFLDTVRRAIPQESAQSVGQRI